MKEVKWDSISENVFTMFEKEWALLTAGTKERFNAMTVSWGAMGILWNKPVVTVYVRPTRYTYSFMEDQDWFTVSFYPKIHKETLSVMGTKSGRDVDKVALCGLNPVDLGSTMTFLESRLTFVCRKIYWNDLDQSHFLDPVIQKNYPKQDYHRMYIGEIIQVLTNE